jgi:hypothetical protein
MICDGWLTSTADPRMGVIHCADKQLSVSFNNHLFAFHSQNSFKTEYKIIAKEAAKIWKIIQANLGIDEILRVGCRIYFLIATTSIDESEKRLEKAEFNIVLPKYLTESDYRIKNRVSTVILSRGDIEYRISLEGVIRHEAISPNNLIKEDPRFLSSKQNAVRMAQLRQLAEYKANPMFAVSMDIDCVLIKPKDVSVEDFMTSQADIIKKDFMPILEKI